MGMFATQANLNANTLIWNNEGNSVMTMKVFPVTISS